jgi:hypothetical protein
MVNRAIPTRRGDAFSPAALLCARVKTGGLVPLLGVSPQEQSDGKS